MMKKIIKKLLNNNSYIYILSSCIYKIFTEGIIIIVQYIMRIFPVQKNKIFIESYRGKGYSDNAKYIVEELLKSNYELDIVWVLKNMEDELPKQVRKVKYNSIRYYHELVTSKVWIDNCRKHRYIRKRKTQYYIQTWHSSLRLKKVEKDAEKYLSKYYIQSAKRDSNMADLMISGSDYSYNTFKNSFWYDGEILKSGTPRCDILFNQEETDNLKAMFYKLYNIEPNKKIILYAPTFRNNNINNNIEQYYKIAQMMKDEDYVFLLRNHPNTPKYENYVDNVIDVTQYPDMQELICIIDILITDYSGCCFDMMLTKKPCILYVQDLEEYLRNERELYFDFEQLPFYKAKDIKELEDYINKFNYNEYIDNINKFLNFIGNYENGNASKQISNRVLEVLKNERI